MTDTQHETADAPAEPQATAKKRSGGLNTMLLAELKSMAGGLGIKGTGSMKKAQLVEAIKAAQTGGQSAEPKRERSQEPQPESREERPDREEAQPRQQRQPRE